MAPSPIAHHLTINLAGIAERLRFRFDNSCAPCTSDRVSLSSGTGIHIDRYNATGSPAGSTVEPCCQLAAEALQALRWADLGSTSGVAACELSDSMVISKIIAAILILRFRQRDSAA